VFSAWSETEALLYFQLQPVHALQAQHQGLRTASHHSNVDTSIYTNSAAEMIYTIKGRRTQTGYSMEIEGFKKAGLRLGKRVVVYCWGPQKSPVAQATQLKNETRREQPPPSRTKKFFGRRKM